MYIKAILYIDQKQYKILEFSYSLDQPVNAVGKPFGHSQGGVWRIVLEKTSDNIFTDWVTNPTMMKNVRIVVYPAHLGKSYTFDLYDVFCVYDKTLFHNANREPMKNYLVFSPAQIAINGEMQYQKLWKITDVMDETEATGIVEEDETEEDVFDLKFIATLKRSPLYDGEYGFDWMRDDYKTISDDYEKLKKEYTPTTIEGEEYFVPWLAMFPEQENVKLELWINKLEGTAKDDDIIKLPSKKGISFEPNEIKVSDAHLEAITVTCDTPLQKNVIISLLDKNDNEIGKLNVLKNANHEQLHFNITPVRILRKGAEESDKSIIEDKIDKGFGDTVKDLAGDLKNLETYLNTQSLNQALIQCKIDKVLDIEIDEEMLIDEDFIIDDNNVFIGDNVLKFFYGRFQKKYPIQSKKRNLIMFLSPLSKEGTGGAGVVFDVDAKQFVIYASNLASIDTFTHEIGHVLGLTHTFFDESYDYDTTTLNEHNTYIKNLDQAIKDRLNNNTPKSEIADIWKRHKDGYRNIRGTLNVHYRNLIKFEKEKTNNFMDYSDNRSIFSKFQWKTMQDDIIKFYKK